MKRAVGALLLAGLGGCLANEPRTDPALGHFGRAGFAREVPGSVGPDGAPVPVTAGDGRTRAGRSKPAEASGLQQAGFSMKDPNVTPAHGTAHGGPMDGPPPLPPAQQGLGLPGQVAAVGAITGAMPPRFPAQRTSVRFDAPLGMKVSWFSPAPQGGLVKAELDTPGRYNFTQAAIYRLKLSNIPGRPQLELYPTLEVVPSNGKTATFLAHSAVQVAFSEEDFEQVSNGNLVVKVIYLPDPQFQDLAVVAGPNELSSARLEPGVDPIVEAQRRGSILLVVRMGNIDLEAPNTPAMDARPLPLPTPAPLPPGAAIPAPAQPVPTPSAAVPAEAGRASVIAPALDTPTALPAPGTLPPPPAPPTPSLPN